jgi:hypothetical protein
MFHVWWLQRACKKEKTERKVDSIIHPHRAPETIQERVNAISYLWAADGVPVRAQPAFYGIRREEVATARTNSYRLGKVVMPTPPIADGRRADTRHARHLRCGHRDVSWFGHAALRSAVEVS